MRNHLLATIVFISASVSAQQFKNENLNSLVEAEHSFSIMAKEENTRDAFISFLADSAITFGPQPRVGKKYLEMQQPNESWLYWYPVYTDIAASGDWGFNTGPWEFRQNKNDEKAVAFGQFVSVWKKQNNDKWKVMIDIGISHPDQDTTQDLEASLIQLNKSLRKTSVQDILSLEKDFITKLKIEKMKAYSTILSSEARLYRADKFPLTNTREILQYLSNSNEETVYQPIAADVASSNDFAFVYGTASSPTDPSKIKGYMRIWKKEDGKNWKLVLDILQ